VAPPGERRADPRVDHAGRKDDPVSIELMVPKLLVLNQSGENIPAYAAMRVTGATQLLGDYVVTVGKPDGSGGPHLFNGPTVIGAGKHGQAQPGPVVSAWFDTTDTVPVGEQFGPVSGEWRLAPGGAGWE